MIYSKLVIGGAQIGLNYGVSNTKGKLNSSEINRISLLAKKNNISYIDTASSYGNSEEVIGKYLNSEWNIITKLSHISLKNNQDLIFKNIKNSFFNSLKNLNRNNIYGLLLHNTDQLKGDNGQEIWESLLELKKEGFVYKIGYSIYDPEELDDIYMNYEPDIIQAPFNIFDQRLRDSGWLEKLNKKEVEVHIRSIFLQGLLLMKPEDRPKSFLKWGKAWDEWDSWLAKNEISALEACINFVFTHKNIDKVVIGINSSSEFSEIIDIILSIKKDMDKILFPSGFTDKNLINPTNWKL